MRGQAAGTSRLTCSPTRVWLVASEISTSTEPGGTQAGEVHDLVVAGAGGGVGSVGVVLDQHLDGPADEALGALAGAALTTSTSRCIRSTFSSCGTGSSSPAASVPRRGEKMNVSRSS